LTDRGPKTTRLFAVTRRLLAAWGVPSAGETVVVALSGGADSVALADVMIDAGQAFGFDVVLAHLDHNLRPESVDDARFCADRARAWGVPVRIGSADVRALAAQEHGGLEEAARHARYAFLRGVRDEVRARWIAVGHNRDDQAETFLLRLLRGSGTDGLASMRAQSGDLLRPLLTLSRAEIATHLHERGLAWREDSSNADATLLRNRVRHELLPYLEARFNPAARETLARSAQLLADDSDALEAAVEARYAGVIRREGSRSILGRDALQAASVADGRRLLRRAIEQAGGLAGISAHHVDAVRALALAPSASGRRVMLPGRREALMSFGELRIGPAASAAAAYAFALPVPGRVDLPDGLAVTAEPAPGPPCSDARGAVIAAPGDAAPLTVRTRQPGDRVRTNGREMSLKRFLMQHRVPTTERVALPLVASGPQVLWIPGHALNAPGPAAGACVRVRLERTA
jgi:tRNA(Ile)-lysidine synthase